MEASLFTLWRILQAKHGRFVAAVIKRPITIILLVGGYGLVTFGAALLCNALGKLAAAVLWSTVVEQVKHPFLDYQFAKILFGSAVVLLWLHYFMLALRCLRAAVGLQMGIMPVIQLIVVTVFIFAGAHYYVALFTDGKASAYANIHIPARTVNGWRPTDDFVERLFFFPSADTVVDFIYFSAATSATVGFGDISPTTIWSKLLTIVQIGISFVLIVVVLAWVIGRGDIKDPAKSKTD